MGWLGGGILTTFVLGPNVRSMPPVAILEFNSKVLPKVIRFVQAMIGTTFLFGLLLLYFFYNGDLSLLTRTSQGLELTVGIVLALVTAVVVWTVTVPSFRKVIRMAGEALQRQQPPPPEMMKYGKRARQGSLIAIGLLLIILAMMISAGFGLGFV